MSPKPRFVYLKVPDFLDRKQPVPSSPGAPSVFDLTILVTLIVVVVLIISVIYDGGLLSQIADIEVQLNVLREQEATLQEQLSERALSRRIFNQEQRTPHPRLDDREIESIGDHVDVAWDYPSEQAGTYIDYEIEFRSLPRKSACIGSRLVLCADSPVSVLASDGAHRASRIPTVPTESLAPGRYIWRVAAVPAGSVVAATPSLDNRNLLSDWSAFGVFTLDGSQSQRIWRTKQVRVGLDLGQQTIFAQRTGNGVLSGLEVSLVYTIVEHCLEFVHGSSLLHYSRDSCQKFVADHQDEQLTTATHSCPHDDLHACVKFVPIARWGAYPSAVKRKEIDLFIGTVTRAAARERSGLKFTTGYFPFHTDLFAHSGDVDPGLRNLGDWLTRERIVGVIADSTNEYVLHNLIAEFARAAKNDPNVWPPRPATFNSYPEMEAAMDRGEIDGVLVDDALVRRTDWKRVPGLRSTEAWTSYKDHFLRGESEDYAIAVAFDAGDASLYSAIQTALSDQVLKNRYLPALRRIYSATP